MTLRWHDQSLAGGGDVPLDERGDCVRACLTAILGVPLLSMENCHGDGWWDRVRGEVYRYGYDLACIDTRYEPPLNAYWVATLPSLNLGPDPDGKPAGHCVVARGYTLIHDPSLGRKYDQAAWAQAWNDDQVKEGWVLVPLDPAELTPKESSEATPASPGSGSVSAVGGRGA